METTMEATMLRDRTESKQSESQPGAWQSAQTFASGYSKYKEKVGVPFELSSYVHARLAENTIPLSYDGPFSLLECGSGAGKSTAKFIEVLEAREIDYTLHCVEFVPEYCDILKAKFKNNPRVKVFCGDFNKFQSNVKYNAIISTMTMNSLQAEFADAMLKNVVRHARSDAMVRFGFVEVAIVPMLQKWRLSLCCRKANAAKRENFDRLLTIKNDFVSKNQGTSRIECRNWWWPAIRVYTCNIGTKQQ